MARDGELILGIGVEDEEAKQAIGELETAMDDLGDKTEEVGQRSQHASNDGITGMIDLKAAIDLAREAVTMLIDEMQRMRTLAIQFAEETAQNELLAGNLGLTERGAQAVGIGLQAAGADAGDIRGFFDPIQEFAAYVAASPVASDADRERLAELQRLGLNTDLISQGGESAVVHVLQWVASATPQERAQLPAVGVSIEDVQRLVAPATRLANLGGGDVSVGLNQIAERLPTPLDPDRAFAAALNALIDEQALQLGDEVLSGVRENRTPIPSWLLRAPGYVPFIGGFAQQATSELFNLAFGPSDIQTGTPTEALGTPTIGNINIVPPSDSGVVDEDYDLGLSQNPPSLYG